MSRFLASLYLAVGEAPRTLLADPPAPAGQPVPAGPPAWQIPNPPPAAPQQVTNVTDWFIALVKYGGLAAGVIGLAICGIQMMIGRKNRHAMSADGALGIPWTLLGVSLIAMGPILLSTILTLAG
ncbi:hypothetical protein [Protofrankia symbiont of Coriaria ruscifolia]|uniref:hypothetical protein n=1 Tax=Protofrankia symbiont of Coriaria ruscifolia TaxID=1306542 RepID=UPI001A94148B|nr:hypothetical protein [Protofrankia symbiont of Coriaria ruscifolia]